MRLNTKAGGALTHEGAPAATDLAAEQRLRRSLMSCLLWEREFYEDGVAIADRLAADAAAVPPATLAALAREARVEGNLRHAPLLLLTVLARTGAGSSLVAETIEATVQRADELAELVALYWKDGRRPLSAQMKKGLAAAFRKFDGYQLAKYDRDGTVRLRDVLFLVHAKPRDEAQAAMWRHLVDGTLPPPDTWEVALSGGADKRATWERLLRERRLGYLALLRNLRNMVEAGVDEDLVAEAILARRGAQRVLPFRYVAAARACPALETYLDEALSETVSDMPPLPGRTAILVDVSLSMNAKLSRRSDLTRMAAAAALASVVHGRLRVFTFTTRPETTWRQQRENPDAALSLVEVPPRRGMAGVETVVTSQERGGTPLGAAIRRVQETVPHDRLIVVTDEQSHDPVPDPVAQRAYMINVASARNGVGYGRWIHIDGFSESVLRFIQAHESAGAA